MEFEKDSINDINQIKFFFLCKSCNIVPKILLKDNENILFQCPKCHTL